MRINSIVILLCLSLISGCSWLQFPSIHKVTVQQGNIVNQEMVSKLKIGMTMPQVQYILGTPLTPILLIIHAGIIFTVKLIQRVKDLSVN